MENPPLCYQFFFFLFLLSYGVEAGTTVTDGKTNTYIVYMGAASSSQGFVQEDYQAQLLASVLKRNETMERSLLHKYKHGFSGFAARLTAEEARTMAQKPGVISVFMDPILKLHTTRSWDFLQNQADLETNSTPGLASIKSGSDTIIGLFDTGIWPESESFQDTDMGPIPTRWKGVCMEAKDFNASNCNRKLIGARCYYDDNMDDPFGSGVLTPRDTIGHGTHTASTAAGIAVENASYYGLALGTAKGGSPGSRIAAYKVCNPSCFGSTILAAFDDAIHDGVDIISISFGGKDQSFETNPVAIGAFHAMEKGIITVSSVGNDGPISSTAGNAAPWILTVAATTIDRDYEADCVLGGNKVVKGVGINLSTLQKSPIYPLIYGLSAKKNSSSDTDGRNCNPISLEGAKIKGKIVLCDQSNGSAFRQEKVFGLEDGGAVGVVFVDDVEVERLEPTLGQIYPVTIVSSKEATDIHNYINSTRNPVATIPRSVSVIKHKPAPVVAIFSSRGPGLTKNILKPDIAAPGVSILAAWTGANDTSEAAPPGQKQSLFNLASGTSMACPHVSGIAATIKSKNPTWSPAAIKSAIMTTASQLNNEGAPITTGSGLATPYDFGAGELSPSGALDPGLVYETNTEDYLLFLCYFGYNVSTIKLIASVIPDGFNCPQNSSTDLISNLNYPSIAISKLSEKASKKVVSRTVTNVGPDEETTYVANITTPSGLDVKVMPNKLQFTKGSKKLSYQMIFSLASSSPLKDDAFGSITWTNGKYKVRSPFVVSSTD